MRMRIISAAVIVVGLGLVGITLAQQTGEERRNERVKLRAQVARLRAEVEFQQIEQDVDADILKKLMTDMRNLDGMEALKAPTEEQMKSVMTKKAPDIGFGAPQAFEEFKKQFREEAKTETQLDELTAKVARPLLERWKKEFVQKATELNEKRLELAEVEKRYNEAK